MRDTIFSLANTPSLDREMFSDSLDAGFVLVLPFHHGDDLEPDRRRVSTRGEGGGGGSKCEAESLAAPNASGRRVSALRGEEAGRFHEVAGVSIVAVGGPRSR